jgi:hypothetical protein
MVDSDADGGDAVYPVTAYEGDAVIPHVYLLPP